MDLSSRHRFTREDVLRQPAPDVPAGTLFCAREIPAFDLAGEWQKLLDPRKWYEMQKVGVKYFLPPCFVDELSLDVGHRSF